MFDNDNPSPDDELGLPKWAEDLLDKHDLWFRTEEPIDAVCALVTDAASEAEEVGQLMFGDQAVTSETLQRLRAAIAQLEDAVRLASLCRKVPIPGVVTKHDDGGMTWSLT